MISPNWIKETLIKNNFSIHKTFIFIRGKDTAYIGTSFETWSVAVYCGDFSGVFKKREYLEKFLKEISRKRKLKRIISN